MTKKKKTLGRPRTISSKGEEARNVTLRFPGKQYRAMMRKASKAGVTLSQWIRSQTA